MNEQTMRKRLPTNEAFFLKFPILELSSCKGEEGGVDMYVSS